VYNLADYEVWREHRKGLLREARGLARALRAAEEGPRPSFEKPFPRAFQLSAGGWVLRLQKLPAGDPAEAPKVGR